MSGKGFFERNEKILSLSLLVTVVIVWMAVLLIENPPNLDFIFSGQEHMESIEPGQESPEGNIPHSMQSFEGCYIEYGYSECIDGHLITPFYNPGTEEIRRVSLYFYNGEDVDIYNVREPLAPGKTETLTTIPCTTDFDTRDVKLEWCCEQDCDDTLMDEPSDDLSIVTV